MPRVVAVRCSTRLCFARRIWRYIIVSAELIVLVILFGITLCYFLCDLVNPGS